MLLTFRILDNFYKYNYVVYIVYSMKLSICRKPIIAGL